jgi:predicted phosphodiesterase
MCVHGLKKEADMRIAVVSDIHGNLTAFEEVLADLRRCSPDLVLHGGDLADGGSSPLEIVDHLQSLGWPGVMGNTDEMLVKPDSLEEFTKHSSAPPVLWDMIRKIASATRSILGEERLAWLSKLPRVNTQEGVALVHATPESCWRTPPTEATDAVLEALYGSVGQPTIVFGHTHRPFIRVLAGQPRLLINTGSVGLSYNGDPRASYLILEDGVPSIRKVEYNVEKELRALTSCGLPGSEWTARMLKTSSPQLP